MILKTRVFACLPVLLLLLSIGRAHAQAPQIWFAPPDDMPRRAGQTPGRTGFAELWQPGAPWQQALRHVDVFELNAFYAFHAAPDALRALFGFLRVHHVALATAFGPLYGHDGCGFNVEGYSAPHMTAAIAKRIAKLGGQLDYASMDEPLFYGHFFNGRNACHASVATLARLTAEGAAEMRAVFPDVKIGDIEPMAAIAPAAVAQWLAAYRAASGRPLAFYQFDVQWNLRWQQLAIAQARTVQLAGVAVGVIYDAGPSAKTERRLGAGGDQE